MAHAKAHPEHHINMVPGDVAPTVLIVEDRAQVLLFAQLVDEAHPVAEKREYVTCTGQTGGVPVSCTSTGMGCPATSIGVEELYHIGAKNILRLGTCMPIQPRVRPGDLIVATGAVRDEHTSEEYISKEYPAVADYRLVRALSDACLGLGSRFHTGIVRTHDAYYLESPGSGGREQRLMPWVDLGVLGVDLESSVLFVLASMSGYRAGALLLARDPGSDNAGQIAEEETASLLKAGIAAARILASRGLAG
jgi:uridine phosphorylase